MKFKTKEDLNKEHSYPENTTHYVVEDCFKSFAERVEFYKKYNGHDIFRTTEKLKKDDIELYDKCSSYIHKNDWTNGSDRAVKALCFRDWLFDYCFGEC